MGRMGNESTMGWRGWEMRTLWDGEDGKGNHMCVNLEL